MNIGFFRFSTCAKMFMIVSLFGITEYNKRTVIFSGVIYEMSNALYTCVDRVYPSVHLSVT